MYYISWESEKGFGATRKWIPNSLVKPVNEAVNQLTEIGKPAREAAKFVYENPGVFMRHSGCTTTESFPENKGMTVGAARAALGLTS